MQNTLRKEVQLFILSVGPLYFSGQQTTAPSENPRGVEGTDDIFKRVIFLSSAVTFSAEVTALTSARQLCESLQAFLSGADTGHPLQLSCLYKEF